MVKAGAASGKGQQLEASVTGAYSKGSACKSLERSSCSELPVDAFDKW